MWPGRRREKCRAQGGRQRFSVEEQQHSRRRPRMHGEMSGVAACRLLCRALAPSMRLG